LRRSARDVFTGALGPGAPEFPAPVASGGSGRSAPVEPPAAGEAAAGRRAEAGRVAAGPGVAVRAAARRAPKAKTASPTESRTIPNRPSAGSTRRYQRGPAPSPPAPIRSACRRRVCVSHRRVRCLPLELRLARMWCDPFLGADRPRLCGRGADVAAARLRLNRCGGSSALARAACRGDRSSGRRRKVRRWRPLRRLRVVLAPASTARACWSDACSAAPRTCSKPGPRSLPQSLEVSSLTTRMT
jgi:hypothetical protein